MGKSQAIPKYFVIFLALVACNNSLLTHARPIKPMNQHSSQNTGNVVADFEVSGATDANAFRPTTPGNSPGVGHHFAVEDNNMKAMGVVQNQVVEVSATERSESGFKPTNPGHSPGVGHGYQTKIEH